MNRQSSLNKLSRSSIGEGYLRSHKSETTSRKQQQRVRLGRAASWIARGTACACENNQGRECRSGAKQTKNNTPGLPRRSSREGSGDCRRRHRLVRKRVSPQLTAQWLIPAVQLSIGINENKGKGRDHDDMTQGPEQPLEYKRRL